MSATTFKVQRIRSCVSCGDVLAQKCTSCVKHPDRKPRVVEYHNWPPILKVAECGCCVLIACQRSGCTKTRWATKKQSATGLSRSESLYCSKRCNLVTLNSTKDTTQVVPCSWKPCGRPVRRRAALLKTFKAAYCRPDHYFLARKKAAHEAQAAARASAEATDRALLECSTCAKVRGQDPIQEHATPKNGPAMCLRCGTNRAARVSAMSSGESAALSIAGRVLMGAR